MKTSQTSAKTNLLYSLVQGSFWINSAIVVEYASIFLLDRGISNSQIGILFASSGLLAFIIQPFIGNYADSTVSPSLRWIILYFCIFTVIMALLLCFSDSWPAILSGILYCICLVTYRILVPLVNSLGTESINQGIPVNMGLARGFGSVIYAVAASLMGFLILKYGNSIVPFCVISGFVLLALFTFLFPFRKTEHAPVSERSPETPSGTRELFRNYPDFAVFLIGSCMVCFALEMMATFQYQIVADRGGNSYDLGHIMSICAVSELPALFLFSFLLKKKTCDFWVRLSAFFIAFKCFGLMLAPDVHTLMAVQLLQSLGWAVYTIAPVYYVNRLLPVEYAVRGQSFFNMTFLIGTIISSLIGGRILDTSGTDRLR